MKRDNKRRGRFILLVMAVALLLAACSRPSALTPGLEETEVALIDDSAIDEAVLEVATSLEELNGTNAGSVADGEESELLSLEGEGDLSGQAVLPGASGFIAYIRHDPNISKPWEIRLANQATDAKTLVYAGTRQIQSVAVSLDGSKLIFAMKRSTSSGDYEIYRLVVSSGAVTRLTSTSTPESNVSISANGNTFVWEGTKSGGKRAVFIRQYSGSSFTSKVLSSTVDQLAPSVSGDGNYIAFIRRPSSSSYEIIRYNKLNNSYLSVSTSTKNVLMHPSVSNGGGKVAWLARVSTGDQVRIKDTVTGNVTTAVSFSGTIEHPHMTADGGFLTYGLLQNSSISAYTMNLSTAQTAVATSTKAPKNVYAMYWQKAVQSTPATVTIEGTVTLGSGISSSASAYQAGVDTAKKEAEVRIQEAPDVSAPRSLRELRVAAQKAGAVSVIVDLDVPFTPEGKLSAREVREQRKAVSDAQKALLQTLPRNSVKRSKTLTTIPALALTVDAEGLDALIGSGIVASVQDDAKLYPSLAESVALISGDVAWDAGYDGSGWTVAIIDTGIDTSHPFLSARIVDEACFVSNYTCPNGTNEQTGRGASVPAENESHGSHVAGIAAGQGSSFSGVARGATIMAVDVFATYDGRLSAQVSDVLRGLEYVYLQRNALRIASVNMSLGSGGYTSSCDGASPSMNAVIYNLRSVDVATIASSGNSSYTDAIGFPACISSVISVGATGDGSNGSVTDSVMSYSNSASFMDFWAPGSAITSSIPGGGFATYGGTSMAAPHVAGAWAVMKQRFPDGSVDDIYSRFQTTGTSVTDTRNGITKPRIDVYRALNRPTPPPPPIRVKLFNAATGALVQEVAAGSSGQYSFTNVPAGRYYVAAYADKNNDGRQGGTEPAGAFGRAAIPQRLDAVSGSYTANIVIGTPTEVEPNDDRSTNNVLLVSTYINGYIEDANYYDYFKLLVPAAGSYTLSTLERCSFDTVLDLYNSSGATLATNDDSDGSLCSLISYNFTQAGTYFVRVRSFGHRIGGNYTLTFQR